MNGKRLFATTSVAAMFAALMLIALPINPVYAAGIDVNSTVDVIGDDGVCTLREAITSANTDSAPSTSAGECADGDSDDTITFSVSGPITLTSALPNITSTMTIDGAGQSITVSGDSAYRVFYVDASGDLSVNSLTITDGTDAPSLDGGGGIHNSGALTVTNSTVFSNTAAEGGGIYNASGTATVASSTVFSNTAIEGGGIYNATGGTATVVNSTLSRNRAANTGGGLHNNPGSIMALTNSTVFGNIDDGIWSGGTLTLTNSIVANSVGGDDCVNSAGIVTGTHTLIGNSVGNACDLTDGDNGNLVGADPQLGPLQDNGGPTQTHALPPGGPALNRGDDALAEDAAGNALGYDQRGPGYERISNDKVDMGAFEYQCLPFPRTASNPTELDDAIQCYNDITTSGEYTITFLNNIDLVASTVAVDNNIPGVTLAIEGAGHAIDGQNLYGVRPFEISINCVVAMNQITVTGGNADRGAGICNFGDLVLTNSFVVSNMSGQGGGIYHTLGELDVSNSTISANTATYGGGIYKTGGTGTLANSTVDDNMAGFQGGGIYSEYGVLTVSNSTVSGNRATTTGGGIDSSLSSDLAIVNSTVSDNFSGGSGSGINNAGTLTITNSIVANSTGGADDCSNTTKLTVNYSLIEAPGNCATAVGAGAGNISTQDPLLAALQNNGGATRTHALLKYTGDPAITSPALNAGDNASAVGPDGAALDYDQRGIGFPRKVDVKVDMGAYEGMVEIFSSHVITVAKALIPADDDGRFIMQANGNSGAQASHGALVTATVQMSETVHFTETAGAETDLANYTTSFTCDNGGPSGSGASGSLSMPAVDVTCTFTNTRKTATLTVTKHLEPMTDDGLFVMQANGNSGTEAGHGALVTATVQVSETVHFTETAGAETDLANYTTSFACDNGGPSGSGVSGSLSMPAVDVTCTFTNTRKTATLTVTKHLEPMTDDGLFVMQANGNSGTEAGHGALVTATVQVSETVHFTETAGAETDLANYTTSFACDNGGPSGSGASGRLTMPAVDVTCTFTNTRKTATLTVTKHLEPMTDDGLFVMQANGNSGAQASHGALVTATVQMSETVHFTETAGAETDLANYTTSFTCDNGGPSGSGVSGSLSMPAVDVTCTFTNTRKTATLTVTKHLEPMTDDGLFVMQANGNSGTEADHGALVTATVQVSETVHFTETAGAETDLANYTTSFACDNGGPSGSGASGRLTMPAVDVTCTFTNTRKTATLTVTKHLEPMTDDGLFVMQANGNSGAQAGHGALVTATVQMSETVHFTETAGAETDLANYTTSFACDNGGPSGSGASGRLTMPAVDVTCTFTNTRRSETLTVTKSGAGAGAVTSNPGGIDCGPTCVASFPAGTSIALTAVPDAKSVFAGWSGGCDANGNVTIIASTTCNAAFLEDAGIKLPYYLPLILR